MEAWKSLFEMMAAAVLLVGAVISTVSVALTKLNASPNQHKIKATFKAALNFSPALLSFAAFIFFKSYEWAAIFWFPHMLLSIGRFLRVSEPPTRREIVFELVFPIAFFLMLVDFLN